MIEITIALIIFLFPLAYSPGRNMFLQPMGARFGFAATVPSNIGYHIATWLVTVVIGLGMITALNDYPNAFGIENIGRRVCFMARLETDPRR